MNASLRPFSDSDYEQLLQIESKIQIAPWNQFQFEGELSKPYSRMWVLTDDETDSEIMGYVVFWDMKESFEILNLGVAPSHQRRGFARKIVRGVINEALRAGATRLILDVRKSNAPALLLYQSLGFTITQIRKSFYSNGEDGYFMTLSLVGLKTDF
jgi:ribosomal-protein-alanine N-acetyltransferase